MRADAIEAARFKSDVDLLETVRAGAAVACEIEETAARGRGGWRDRCRRGGPLRQLGKLQGVGPQGCDLLVAEYRRENEGDDDDSR